MDAHAHLLSLGWAGPGHSLDSRPRLQHKGRRGLAYDPSLHSNTGRGLVKPLLISQKKNSFGIGRKIHEPAAGNDWWLKGFEDALSNIGKNTASETSGTATPERPTASISNYRGKHAGLYGFFVQGQQIEGTIDEHDGTVNKSKRKSDIIDQDSSTPPTSPTIKAASSSKKRKSKARARQDFEQINQFMEVCERDRNRLGKRNDMPPRTEFEHVGSLFGLKTENQETHEAGIGEKVQIESKDERRRRRKAEKEARRRAEQTSDADEKSGLAQDLRERPKTRVETHQTPLSSREDSPSEETLRKAERKKRKELRRRAKLDKEV